jgi:hypothetical protein
MKTNLWKGDTYARKASLVQGSRAPLGSVMKYLYCHYRLRCACQISVEAIGCCARAR